METQREYWIDAIRSFACICVITVHAPIPSCGSGEALVSITNYFSVAGASILFFMISGALVLYRERSFLPFVKIRFLRVFLPMMFWSIVYLVVEVIRGNLGFQEMFNKILLIPLYPQQGTYWFIYVIFGIYLVTPIISTWLSRASKKDVQFYLLIWGTTLFFPYLELLPIELFQTISSENGFLYYFWGYVGFAILGYYLRKYTTISKFKIWHLIIILFVLLTPILLYSFTSIPHGIIHRRTSINIVALSICYFIFFKAIHYSQMAQRILYCFAQHSFGIYLVHILVMKRLLWPIIQPLDLNYYVQIPLVVFLTAVISFLVVHLISKMPFSKYIIGL